MANTINESFLQFKSRLEITQLQQQTVSERQEGVRNAIAAELKVLDSFLTGSYRRNTMIAPLDKADIDIFIILDTKYFESNGHIQLIDKVKRTLKKKYPTTPKISRNGQAVTITFRDFIVDVVPAFSLHDKGFLIPDSENGRWISTDPKQHVDFWSGQNKWHEGKLVPLIKMLKAWNRAQGSLFRSFHLEALILKILSNVTISDFPSAVRFFLIRQD